MKILMVCSELAPWAKTGGLADAVAGLGSALSRRGHDVVVLLPCYAHLEPSEAEVHEHGEARYLVAADEAAGYRVCLLDLPRLFDDTPIYTMDARDAARFAALCAAAARLPDALGWSAEVVHCHDWHAGLVPRLVAAPTLLSLHNIGYQGDFESGAIAPAAWPELAALTSNERVNFLRTGIEHADRISTVSPTYAREILTPEYGMGLEHALRPRARDLIGILNGVDYGTWSPECDPHLSHHYDRRDVSPKQAIKAELAAASRLESSRPLIGAVTRLVEQKGMDLLTAALPTLLAETDAAFVVLGSGEPGMTSSLEQAAAAAPNRVAFRQGYDEILAHRILAGSDFVLVPSRYEPCGLTQLYALRYGSIPIVRKTGGLADTVTHFVPELGTGNGSVFEHADPGGVIWGTKTALSWYRNPHHWRRVIDNAMSAEHGWDGPASEYEAVYRALAMRARSSL